MRNTLDLLASVSRIAIAAAIVYFGYQLAQINANVGEVRQTVDGVTQQIPPTLEEVRAIRLEVAAINAQIPDILAEVEEVRTEIPAILAEVGKLQANIPVILAQVDPILRRVDRSLDETTALRQQLPQVLQSVDAAVAGLNQTRDQVVPLVPPALEEIRLTREKVDPTLDRVETMLDDAFVRADQTIAGVSEAGKKASEGAVKGFFTGLVKLPFQLVGTIASPIVKTIDSDVAEKLTERDLELMTEASNRAVKSERLDREVPWSNRQSGNSGSVTVTRVFQLRGYECVEARIQISHKGKQIQDKTAEYCRGEDDAWVLASEIGS